MCEVRDPCDARPMDVALKACCDSQEMDISNAGSSTVLRGRS